MKKEVIFLLLAVAIVQGMQVELHQLQQQESHETLELPRYMNRGYDIFLSSPLSQSNHDSGYRHIVFQSTYNKKNRTEDQKFAIPDDLSWTQQTACSSEAQTTEIKGTKSFQKSLENIVSITGGYTGVFSASFSLSTDYKRVESETISNHYVSYQSTSDCVYYTLKNHEASGRLLQPLFVDDVMKSHRENRWMDLIYKYGTHFLTQIQYGGRYTRRLTYTSESVAKMKSQSINVQAGVQAEYAGCGGSLAVSNTVSTKSASSLSKTVSSPSSFFVGGISTSDIDQWKNSVRDNPMPVKLKMSLLSGLFYLIPGIDQNGGATAAFLRAVEQYSKKGSQPKEGTDLFLNIQMKTTQDVGGTGGGQYKYVSDDKSTVNLKKITLRCGGWVDQMKLWFSDGTNWHTSQLIGNSQGGHVVTFEVDDGDRINSIEVWTGAWLDGIQFTTAKGKISELCGSQRTNQHRFTIDKDWRIIGFKGRRGGYPDRVGFVLGKTIFSTSQAFVPTITHEGKVGGTGGGAFESIALDPAHSEIRRINVRSGSLIDHVRFFYGTSGTNPVQQSEHFGGHSGGEHEFYVPNGEYLSEIKIVYGNEHIDSIQFVNSGGSSQKYGGDKGNKYKTFSVRGTNKRFVGGYGSAGSIIDSLGFITATRP